MPLRVLHLNAGNLYGGVETVLVTIAREHACCPGMESHFALCFPGRVADELTAAGATPTILGAVRGRYPWQVWRARNRFRQLLHDEAFDVVVCHMPWSLAVFGPVVKQCARPLVFWMHGPASGESWIERWSRRSVPDLVLCNSGFTAGTLPNLFREAPPSTVIYCPVARPVYSNVERDKVRAEFRAGDSEIVVIEVGRIEAGKGHAVLLEALANVPTSLPWRCWIVGGAQRPQEAALLEELRKQARVLGLEQRIHFAGERNDVSQLLFAADIYCQPNTAPDSFGISLVEAMHAGLPVVTSAIGGAVEVVDETCGRLLAAGDSMALAQVLTQLIGNPTLRRELGRGGPAAADQVAGTRPILVRLNAALSALKSSFEPKGSARSPE